MVRRIIYPPMWLAIAIGVIFALNEYLPGPRFTSLAGQLLGGEADESDPEHDEHGEVPPPSCPEHRRDDRREQLA